MELTTEKQRTMLANRADLATAPSNPDQLIHQANVDVGRNFPFL